MNASAFRDLRARVMFWSSENCTSRRWARFENFKTSRASVNQEMHEQVHVIFCLLYSQQLYFRRHKILATFYRFYRFFRFSWSYSLIFWLTFRSVKFCQTFNQVCVVFKVFWVLFSFSYSTSLSFEIVERLSPNLLSFSNLALAGVSIETALNNLKYTL